MPKSDHGPEYEAEVREILHNNVDDYEEDHVRTVAAYMWWHGETGAPITELHAKGELLLQVYEIVSWIDQNT